MSFKPWPMLGGECHKMVIQQLSNYARVIGEDIADQRERRADASSSAQRGDIEMSIQSLHKNQNAFEAAIAYLNMGRNRAPDGSPIDKLDEDLKRATDAIRKTHRNKTRQWDVDVVSFSKLKDTLNGFAAKGYTIYSIRSQGDQHTIIAFRGK